MAHPITRFSLLGLTSIVFLGAFSRFTHGVYTPSFYAYQLDRAPNNENTWLIPICDTLLGTLLLFFTTRPYGALLCALGQGVGIWMRLGEGKDVTRDVGFFLLALFVFANTGLRRIGWIR
jgi:hypothetical protein